MKKHLTVGIIATLLGIAVALAAFFGWFRYAELFYEDILYQRGDVLNNNIKIIAIDDKTMAELGEFGGWSRQYYADLINTLHTEEGKPAVIAFDVMFFDTKDAEGDAAFAEACKEHGNIVVASKLTSTLQYEYDKERVNIVHAVDSMEPYDSLKTNVTTGFVDFALDEDGILRHSLARVSSETGVYRSFSSTIFDRYQKVTGTDTVGRLSEAVFWIDYTAGPGSYEAISMCDVLYGRVPAEVFKDCIVLVGGFSEGMRDSFSVPIDRKKLMYGVEINANIVQSLLSGKRVGYTNKLITAMVIGIMTGCFFAFTNRKKIKYMTVALVLLLTGHIFLCLGLYRYGLICPVLYPVLGYAAAYVINIVWKYIRERRLRTRELHDTLFSMAEAMTEAIDGRTPYNASHTRHVAEYAMKLAAYINVNYKKGLTKLHLNKKEIEQLHLAALLHDVGKMDIPKRVLDKPSRLGENLSNFLYKIEKMQLVMQLDMARGDLPEEIGREKLAEVEALNDFVQRINVKEWLSNEEREYIEQVRAQYFESAEGERIPYLSDIEYECLTIAKGTLTKDEMDKVHEHVVYTDKILGKISFGRNYENVRRIASSHHELLNGKGYPRHLKADEIDVSVRILTIADVYDALTADDRPYKKAKSKADSFKILHFMEKDGEIDGEILKFAEEIW